MSYYPHFVDSLARIFHLFTVKPGNSNSKVMSSPILTAYKTMKKDLSNRLSLIAYESEFAFELTGHFCSAVAGRQFQSVVVSWMGWWSTLGALWWWKNEAPAWAHLLFCSPLGAPQGRLSSFYRRKKKQWEGNVPRWKFASFSKLLPPNCSEDHLWFSEQFPTRKEAWFSKLWIFHPDLDISPRTLQICRTLSVLYVTVQEMWVQIKCGKRCRLSSCELRVVVFEKEKKYSSKK